MIHVFCPARDTLCEYEKYFPGCNVYETFDKKKLERIIDEQKHLSEVAKAGHASPPPRVGIVLDDFGWNKSDVNSTPLRYLLMNGRHDNFSLFMGVQMVIDFPRDLRSQVDLVIAFPERNMQYREQLRKSFLAAVFHSDDPLKTVFFEGLKSHEALVFDCNAHRRHRPHLFFCKAEDVAAIGLPLSGRVGPPLGDEAVLRTLLPSVLTFVETSVTVTRAIVTFAFPVPIDLHNTNEEDGSVTLFSKEDVFGLYMRRGKADILVRQNVSEDFRKFTGLKYAYKTVSGAATLTWASNNMLLGISVESPIV
jgi:hypothetical protein